jgi:hypothetical protein
MPTSHFLIHFDLVFQVASIPDVFPRKPCGHLSWLLYVLRALFIIFFLIILRYWYRKYFDFVRELSRDGW